MTTKQKGLCAICGHPETTTWRGRVKMLCVDHDHLTGKVRSLLCDRCNKAIGLMEDSTDLLRKTKNYLEGN